jgi:hypothetical protein
MLRSTDIAGDVLGRVAHLLVTALVLGGLVLGPVAHVQVQPDAAGAEWSHEGHEPGSHSDPDAHHDCPVCLTLASVAAPVLPPVPASLLSDGPVVVAPGAAVHDRGLSDTERARAPPIS